MDKHQIAEQFRQLQDNICTSLEAYDGKGIFEEDFWKRPGGGGGRTRILQNANIIEKGGVNFSAVEGDLPDKILQGLKLEPSKFFATGVSIVLHPFNPHVPIIHMNVRYFEMESGQKWFGGGIDLTPHYIVAEDARFFHQQLKRICDNHHADYYPRFKEWADNYFYIPHRKETRGIGGIFFDRLNETEEFNMDQRAAFVMELGNHFFPIYRELMERNKDRTHTKAEKQWQLVRRGRYVEFNLVYDRGTKFGLETDGRIESILMSLPPEVNWKYNFLPQEDEAAMFTQENLKKEIDWVNYSADHMHSM